MRSNTIIAIVDRIEGLDVDDEAKRLFRRLVLDVGAVHGIRRVSRFEQVEYARRLLDLRVSRATIRDRIVALFSVSRRQSYRLISDALKLCQMPT